MYCSSICLTIYSRASACTVCEVNRLSTQTHVNSQIYCIKRHLKGTQGWTGALHKHQTPEWKPYFDTPQTNSDIPLSKPPAPEFITSPLMKHAAKSQRAAKKDSCELGFGNLVHNRETLWIMRPLYTFPSTILCLSEADCKPWISVRRVQAVASSDVMKYLCHKCFITTHEGSLQTKKRTFMYIFCILQKNIGCFID